MTLYEVIKTVKNLGSIAHINSTFVGDVYELNHQQNIQYPAMVITQGTHYNNTEDEVDEYNLNIFLVDRLTEDKSNELDVQDWAYNGLTEIVNGIEISAVGYQSSASAINPFTERFNSLCAGAFINLTITVPQSTCQEARIVTSVNGKVGDVKVEVPDSDNFNGILPINNAQIESIYYSVKPNHTLTYIVADNEGRITGGAIAVESQFLREQLHPTSKPEQLSINLGDILLFSCDSNERTRTIKLIPVNDAKDKDSTVGGAYGIMTPNDATTLKSVREHQFPQEKNDFVGYADLKNADNIWEAGIYNNCHWASNYPFKDGDKDFSLICTLVSVEATPEAQPTGRKFFHQIAISSVSANEIYCRVGSIQGEEKSWGEWKQLGIGKVSWDNFDDYLQHNIALKSDIPNLNDYTGELNVTGNFNQMGNAFMGTENNYVAFTDDSIQFNGKTPTINNVEIATKKDIEDIEMAKVPNVTIFGEPTIQNGQISDFSANDYVQFPFLVDFRNRPFVIDMCFTTGVGLISQQNIIDSAFGLAIAVRNNTIVVAMSSNGTDWNMGEHIASTSLKPNTTYYVMFAFDGAEYSLDISTNRKDYINIMALPDERTLYPTQIVIGKDLANRYIYGGSINLNYCSLSIAGNQVWQGMDDVGLSTRLTTDLSNIDAKGEEKVKELSQQLYWCKWGVTTNAEIEQALADGFIPCVKYTDGSIGIYGSKSNINRHIFNCPFANYMFYYVCQNNTWTYNGALVIENGSNKQSAITDLTSTTKYPSNKAVVDYGETLIEKAKKAMLIDLYKEMGASYDETLDGFYFTFPMTFGGNKSYDIIYDSRNYKGANGDHVYSWEQMSYAYANNYFWFSANNAMCYMYRYMFKTQPESSFLVPHHFNGDGVALATSAINYFADNCYYLEGIYYGYNSGLYNMTSFTNSFYKDSNLEIIAPYIRMNANGATFTNSLGNCLNLRYCKIAVNKDCTLFQETPRLYKGSLFYTLNEHLQANTSFTLTVHNDIYKKLTGLGDEVAEKDEYNNDWTDLVQKDGNTIYYPNGTGRITIISA